ncbi:MAG: FdtA/QdtA family cupin domain-containing protein [Pseudomonadota bacterium]
MAEPRPRHRLVAMPVIGDERGLLLFAETRAQVPFDIERLFVLFDLPDGAHRGAHAHRRQHQFLMMLAGSCTVTVDDGLSRTTVPLDSPSTALYVPPMLWLDLADFAAGSICGVLTSGVYDATDYIRDRVEFNQLSARLIA